MGKLAFKEDLVSILILLDKNIVSTEQQQAFYNA